MNISSALGFRPPFTAAQWEELEQQALIFKYMMAGVPVPPELLVLIRRSFDPIPSRFYHHASLGYCSYDGRKLDPEPGRCRRTDGKKWRCSKDAHPDSKYCERHMHRSRSRSRKPVESQSHSQSQSSLSTVTSLTPSGTNGTGNRSVTGSFRNIPSQHHTASGSILQGSSNGVSSGTQLHMDLGSYGMDNKDYRYLYGVKAEGDEHSFFSEASGRAKGLEMDNSSSLESSWSLLPSRASLFPVSKASDSSMMQGSYPQLHQYSFFGCEFGSSNPLKLESQSLRPFFDEWPKTKDLWSDLDEGRLNDTPFSPTQLSISIPMASSDFSTTRDTSPNEDL